MKLPRLFFLAALAVMTVTAPSVVCGQDASEPVTIISSGQVQAGAVLATTTADETETIPFFIFEDVEPVSLHLETISFDGVPLQGATGASILEFGKIDIPAGQQVASIRLEGTVLAPTALSGSAVVATSFIADDGVVLNPDQVVGSRIVDSVLLDTVVIELLADIQAETGSLLLDVAETGPGVEIDLSTFFETPISIELDPTFYNENPDSETTGVLLQLKALDEDGNEVSPTSFGDGVTRAIMPTLEELAESPSGRRLFPPEEFFFDENNPDEVAMFEEVQFRLVVTFEDIPEPVDPPVDPPVATPQDVFVAIAGTIDGLIDGASPDDVQRLEKARDCLDFVSQDDFFQDEGNRLSKFGGSVFRCSAFAIFQLERTSDAIDTADELIDQILDNLELLVDNEIVFASENGGSEALIDRAEYIADVAELIDEEFDNQVIAAIAYRLAWANAFFATQY